MFYAGTRDLNISSTLQKNISVGVFGGEGLFQTQVKGSGVVVLYSPVLANEVQKIELDNEKLSVDGNFALLRTAEIDFKAEKVVRPGLGLLFLGKVCCKLFRNGLVSPNSGDLSVAIDSTKATQTFSSTRIRGIKQRFNRAVNTAIRSGCCAGKIGTVNLKCSMI